MALFDSKKSKLNKKLEEIKNKIPKYENLDLSEFKEITQKFREELENGKSEEDILVDAYALIYCAFNKLDQKRIIENNENRDAFNYYDCQLKTSIALNDGDLVQMLTGEGKTYALTPAAYLNAISGKGVYVITANEYLVERDCNENKELFDVLGLTAKHVSDAMSDEEKKEGYDADITYVTASTAAFDYLRDNKVEKIEDKIQRGFNYAIVDELDSILIDDANTPFIISESQTESKKNYKVARKIVEDIKKYAKDKGTSGIVKLLEPLKNVDKYDLASLGLDNYFIYSEADNETFISEEGIKAIDNILDNLGYKPITITVDNETKEIHPYEQLATYINDAFKVEFLMKKDVDYTVVDGKIKLIDQNLGRISENSKYSNGIHQALEAKEGLEISTNQISTAFINQPNFFGMFKKISGLSGTLLDSKKELKDVYGKDIIEMEPNKELKRIDYETEVTATKKEKSELIIDEIIKNHKQGRPILVGTDSIEECEYYSKLLQDLNINHNTLHAKNTLEEEAEIIRNAGKYGSITITTAMAGRGTDIKLDDKAKEAGGLCVIGTSYSNSKRVDDQLRGRAGRQGEKGSSKFIISLEDKIFKNNCNEKIIEKIKKMCTSGLKQKARDFAKYVQQKITLNEEAQRKQKNEIMSIDDEIRRNYYRERDEVLKSKDIKKLFQDIIQIGIKNKTQMLLDGNLTIEDFKNQYQESILSPEVSYLLDQGLNKNNIRKITVIMQQNIKEIMQIYDQIPDNEIRKLILDLGDKYYTEFINSDLDRKLEASLSQYSGEKYDLIYTNTSFNIWNDKMRSMQNELLDNTCNLYKKNNKKESQDNYQKEENKTDNEISKLEENSNRTVKINYNTLTKKEILLFVAKAITSKKEEDIILTHSILINNKILDDKTKTNFLNKLPVITKDYSKEFTELLNKLKYSVYTKEDLIQIKNEFNYIADKLTEEQKKQINIIISELEEKLELVETKEIHK